MKLGVEQHPLRRCPKGEYGAYVDDRNFKVARLRCAWCALLILPVLTIMLAPPTAAAEESVRLQCTPRKFQVVPGQPIRLELILRTDSAASFRWHVPDHPLLKLRTLEKLPVRLSPKGVIVYRRMVLWQALGPGVVSIDKLSVETKGRKRLFPEVTITVRDPGP